MVGIRNEGIHTDEESRGFPDWQILNLPDSRIRESIGWYSVIGFTDLGIFCLHNLFTGFTVSNIYGRWLNLSLSGIAERYN